MSEEKGVFDHATKKCFINKALLQQALARDNRKNQSCDYVSTAGDTSNKTCSGDDNFAHEVAHAISLELSSFKSISVIENLHGFKRLVRLSLSNNRIDRMQNLDGLTQLEFLNLSFNNIAKIEGLHTLGQLIELSLFSNEIQVIEGLESCRKLTFLSIGNNRIKSNFKREENDNLTRCLEKVEILMAINVKGNPICEHEDYKKLFIAFLPRLKYFDYQKVTLNDREESLVYRKTNFATGNYDDGDVALSVNYTNVKQMIAKQFPKNMGLITCFVEAVVDAIIEVKEYVSVQLGEILTSDCHIMQLIHESLTIFFESVVAEIGPVDQVLREKEAEINEYTMQSTRKSLTIAEDASNENEQEGVDYIMKNKLLVVEMNCVHSIRNLIDVAEVHLSHLQQKVASLQKVFFKSLEKSVCKFFDIITASILNKNLETGCITAEILKEKNDSNVTTTNENNMASFINLRRKAAVDKITNANEDFLSEVLKPISGKIHSMKTDESSRSRNRFTEIIDLVEH